MEKNEQELNLIVKYCLYHVSQTILGIMAGKNGIVVFFFYYAHYSERLVLN